MLIQLLLSMQQCAAENPSSFREFHPIEQVLVAAYAELVKDAPEDALSLLYLQTERMSVSGPCATCVTWSAMCVMF